MKTRALRLQKTSGRSSVGFETSNPFHILARENIICNSEEAQLKEIVAMTIVELAET